MITQGQISSTKTQIYTTPVNTKSYIKTIKLQNTSGSIVQVTIYSLVGGTSLELDSFELESKVGVDSSLFYPFEYLTGEGIEAEATVNNVVNFFILGDEVAT